MELTWPAKDPDDVADYQILWADFLGTDLIATSGIVVESGTVVVDSASAEGTTVTAWLSGGVDGELAVLRNRITTGGGRTFDATINLQIRSSTDGAIPASGHVAPTADDFIARFPAFSTTAVSAINFALAEAAGAVDTSWAEGDFANARLFYAAHTLTLDGYGSGPASKIAGLTGVKSMKSGSLSLEFVERGNSSILETTSYGQRFKRLQRANFAGPRVTGASYLTGA